MDSIYTQQGVLNLITDISTYNPVTFELTASSGTTDKFYKNVSVYNYNDDKIPVYSRDPQPGDHILIESLNLFGDITHAQIFNSGDEYYTGNYVTSDFHSGVFEIKNVSTFSSDRDKTISLYPNTQSRTHTVTLTNNEPVYTDNERSVYSYNTSNLSEFTNNDFVIVENTNGGTEGFAIVQTYVPDPGNKMYGSSHGIFYDTVNNKILPCNIQNTSARISEDAESNIVGHLMSIYRDDTPATINIEAYNYSLVGTGHIQLYYTGWPGKITSLRTNDIIRITENSGSTSALVDSIVIRVAEIVQSGSILSPVYQVKGFGYMGSAAYQVVISVDPNTASSQPIHCYKWLTHEDITDIIKTGGSAGTGSDIGTGEIGGGTEIGGGGVVYPDPSTGEVLKP